MEETEITLDRSPYYIRETDNGIFYVVSKIFIRDNRAGRWKPDETKKLELGLDIIEIPTRGLSLLVRSSPDKIMLPYQLEELRKLSQIAGADYFSYENIGMNAGRFLCTEGQNIVIEVHPRLFRKYIGN